MALVPQGKPPPSPPMSKDFPARSYAPRPRKTAAAATAWEKPAQWYDNLVGAEGDDFYQKLILPTVLKRLDPKPGQTVLDVACGQGVLGRVLAAKGVKSLGVDASPSLIESARTRAGPLEQHAVGDARKLGDAVPAGTQADHAALVMCLQDLDPIAPVLSGTAALIKRGGRVVIALTHPCFRIPRRSLWGWDEEQGMQYRRLDGYLSPLSVPIKIHPGKPEDPTRTTSFHRPISTYLSALGGAGLGVIAADELCSHRRGTKGARSAAEDLSAREFPVFLVLTAVRLG